MSNLDSSVVRKYSGWWGYLLVFLWCVYNLSPLLTTGFIGDDAYNSQIRGNVIQANFGIWEKYIGEIVGWVTDAGRFFPLSWYTYPFYYYLGDNPLVLKVIVANVISISVVLFSLFVKRQVGSLSSGVMVGLVVPLLFQFRLWHDPILSFTFLVPLLFLFCVAALLCFQSYLNTSNRGYLVTASLLYLLAILSYEVAYFLSVLFFLVALEKERNIRAAIVRSSPLLALSLLAVLNHFILPIIFLGDADIYPGSVLHLDILGVVNAFLIQFTAALPLIYKARMHFGAIDLPIIVHWYDWVAIAVCAFFLYYVLVKAKFNTFKRRDLYLLVFGGLLAFIPAFLIGVSGHQAEMIDAGYGFGYIPIYIQYFGIAVLIFGVIKALSRWCSRYIRVFSALSVVLFVFVAITNVSNNRAVAENTNVFYKYPRDLLEASINNGLLDRLGEDPLIIRNYRYPHDNAWNYAKLTNKIYPMCINNKQCFDHRQPGIPTLNIQEYLGMSNPDKIASPLQKYDVSQENVWGISYRVDTTGRNNGVVFLGKIKEVVYDHASAYFMNYFLSELFLYDEKSKDITEYEMSAPVDFMSIINEEHIPKLDDSRIDIDKYYFSGDSIGPFSGLFDDITYSWSGKVHAVEVNNVDNNLRWTSGDVALNLYNSSDQKKSIHVNLTVRNPSRNETNFQVVYPDKLTSFTLTAGQKEVSSSLQLSPGLTRIKIQSDGKILDNGDPRNIVFGVVNFSVRETKPSSG